MQDKAGVTLDRREMLRVKAKSLAEEAKIIRREEKRARFDLRNELREHRVGTVRFEARCTYMAYGLIRGRSVERTEPKCIARPAGMWERVSKMVQRYGPVDAAAKAAIVEKCKDATLTRSRDEQSVSTV
jgi:ribonucleotide reductase alpha subunit